MMLNLRVLEATRIKRLLTFGNSNIKTKDSGINLSTELWDLILEFLIADPDKFRFAQATAIKKSSKGDVLQCRQVTEGGPYCGTLDSADEVREYEKFLKRPANKFYIVPGTEFSILVPSDQKTYTAFLFTDVTVPDVIAFMEDGECGCCSSLGLGQPRFFCPGWGRAEAFNADMGRAVSLACPLCLGVDFCMEHKDFLQTYYWDDVPDDEAEEMDAWIQDRLDELGYTTVKKRPAKINTAAAVMYPQ